MVPPVYPTRVRTTPGMLPNRESTPQNQPRAKVAVSNSAGCAASMGGIVAFAVLVCTVLPPLPTANREMPNAARARTAMPSEKSSVLCPVCDLIIQSTPGNPARLQGTVSMWETSPTALGASRAGPPLARPRRNGCSVSATGVRSRYTVGTVGKPIGFSNSTTLERENSGVFLPVD